MKFSDVIAQAETKKHLINMVKENRLSHALLFLNKPGSGGLPLARALAQYLVCEKVNPSSTTNIQSGPSLFGDAEPALEKIYPQDSCGECTACKKAAEMVHPDIHYTYPVITLKNANRPPISSDYAVQWRNYMLENPYGNEFEWLQYIKAENRQGNITVNETEEIIKTMNLKSYESIYKIQIMWMPEALGTNGNRLLKLIEEPAPNSLFILVASNESKILPTILSRTQLIKIPSLSNQEIAHELEARGLANKEKAMSVALMSDGDYFEALQLIQHTDGEQDQILRSWLNSILKMGPMAQTKVIDEIVKMGRERQKQFLQYFNHIIHQAIRIDSLGFDAAASAADFNTNELAEKMNHFSLEQKEAIVNELDKAIYYIERNANSKIQFHALTIRLYYIFGNKSLILVD